MPDHRPFPLPFNPSYALVLGDWLFRGGLRRFREARAPALAPLPPDRPRRAAPRRPAARRVVEDLHALARAARESKRTALPGECSTRSGRLPHPHDRRGDRRVARASGRWRRRRGVGRAHFLGGARARDGTEREMLSRIAREVGVGEGVRLWLARLDDGGSARRALRCPLRRTRSRAPLPIPASRADVASSRGRGIASRRARPAHRAPACGAALRVRTRRQAVARSRSRRPRKVQFNVSHARDLALIASRRRAARGRRRPGWTERCASEPVVARFFSAPERAVYEAGRRGGAARDLLAHLGSQGGLSQGTRRGDLRADLRHGLQRTCLHPVDGDLSSLASRPGGEQKDQDGWDCSTFDGLPAGYRGECRGGAPHDVNPDTTVLLLVELTAMLAATLLLGRTLRWLGLPALVGELFGGIILGPYNIRSCRIEGA